MTSVFQVSRTITPSSSATGGSSNGGGSSSNTGAIAGGVVGGVVGLAAIGVLVWWLLRRQKAKRISKLFDGNFDPAHVGSGRGPDMGVDLDNEAANDGMGGRLAGADIGAGVVSPYPLSGSSHNTASSYNPYSPAGHGYPPSTPPSPPPMSQHSHESQYPSIYSQYPAMPMPLGMPQPQPSVSGRTSSGGGGLSAKERERYAHIVLLIVLRY